MGQVTENLISDWSVDCGPVFWLVRWLRIWLLIGQMAWDVHSDWSDGVKPTVWLARFRTWQLKKATSPCWTSTLVSLFSKYGRDTNFSSVAQLPPGQLRNIGTRQYWHNAKLECCREKEPRQSLGRVRTVSRDISIFVFYDTVFLHLYTEEIK